MPENSRCMRFMAWGVCNYTHNRQNACMGLYSLAMVAQLLVITKGLCKNRLVNNDKTELKQPESTKPIEQATENRFIHLDKTDISEQPKTAVPEKPKAVEPSKTVIEKNPDIVEQAKAEAVLNAEVKIGELMARVPKATGGQPFQRKSTLDSSVQSRPQTKADIIEKAGFTPKQVQRFETLAKNKDIVEQAKAEARENDDAGANPER